jgi:hypothetical protein
MTALAMPAAIVNSRPIFSSERMLRKDYGRKRSFEKKYAGQWVSRGCKDELIGGKSPAVKYL